MVAATPTAPTHVSITLLFIEGMERPLGLSPIHGFLNSVRMLTEAIAILHLIDLLRS